jgi:hypothetical protein
MPLDIGGGQRGEGGTLADGSANDAVEAPVLVGRQQYNYTPKLAKGLATTIAALELGDDSTPITQYRVVAVNADTITVTEYDGTTDGATVLLARPYLHRRSLFDGVEVTVIYNNQLVTGTYTYETNERRVFELSNGRQILEEIFPAYVVGNLVYGAETTNGTDVDGATVLELNVDGRQFRPVVEGTRQMVVVAEEEDYWVCRPFVSGAIDLSGSPINVAKSFNLRKTPFDITDRGSAFNGIEYTYTVNDSRYERTAYDPVLDQTQTEILIPRVFFEESVIYVTRVEESGVVADGEDLKLLDLNTDARYWTRRG